MWLVALLLFVGSAAVWSAGVVAPLAEGGTACGLFEVDRASDCVFTDIIGLPWRVWFRLQQPDCTDTTGAIFVDSVLGGTPPYLFSIDGGPWQPFPWAEGLESGTHVLRVEDAWGCTFDTSFVLDAVYQPSLSLVGPIRVELGESVVLSPLLTPAAVEIARISWSPSRWLDCTDCLSPRLKPEAEGQFHYVVSVETVQGCRAEAQVMVRVFFRAPIFVPNVFTPDADGDNDLFVPQADFERVPQVLEFAVYDRWGRRLHHVHTFAPGDGAAAWDGMAGAQPAPPAVYVWWVRAQLTNGKKVTLQGDVLLLR